MNTVVTDPAPAVLQIKPEDQLEVWPTHWAGGSSSVQFRGQNVPCLTVKNGPMVAVLLSSRPEYIEVGREIARRFNEQEEMLDMLIKLLPFVEDAENDPAYKKGPIKALLNDLRELIKRGLRK